MLSAGTHWNSRSSSLKRWLLSCLTLPQQRQHQTGSIDLGLKDARIAADCCSSYATGYGHAATSMHAGFTHMNYMSHSESALPAAVLDHHSTPQRC